MLCVSGVLAHAYVASDAPVHLGGEQRIVPVEPARHAGVQDLQRDADLLVRERAARHERLADGGAVAGPERADLHAHASCALTKRGHVHPASSTARWIPTSGPISGFGFTSSTRGCPSASRRTSIRA